MCVVKVNNQSQAIDGNTVIKFIVSDKEMEKASQAELPLNTMPPGMQASGGLRVCSGIYSF